MTLMTSQTTQALTDAPMMVRDYKAGGFVRTNQAFSDCVGFPAEVLSTKPLLEWIGLEDRDAVASMIKFGGSCRARHITQDGKSLVLNLRSDENRVVLGNCAKASPPPSESKDAEATVCATLHTIAQIIEEQNPEFLCSILLVAEGRFVRGAGPSLSEAYNSAIDGFAIGPTVGSCGTAIYWNTPVIVTDIQKDPLWDPFCELAANEGIAACWSHPFVSKGGQVLGALAFYSRVPREPTEQQLSSLRAAARLTGLAVERGRAEEALREKRKRELELEDQLRQAAKMEALGVLAGGVAHDFNNVLTTILANAELAHELTPDGEKLKPLLADIIAASTRAGDFCTQMLAYAGRGTLRTKRVELGSLLPQLNSLVSAALSKKTTLIYNLNKDPIYVEGDENQLLQVVMNLITNAAESMGNSEGKIELSTVTRQFDADTLRSLSGGESYAAGEYVQLTVSDNGCGMPPAVTDRIFDPFYTTKFTGRGLGLAAVKGIVIRHGGLIFLTSEPGIGTTFTVLMPTAIAPIRSASSARRLTPRMTGSRLLVVDDELAIRSILQRRLEKEGFEFLEASDGLEAIEAFKEHKDSIDCVLLDLSMPKLGGEEVCRELLALRPDLPIIIMSGHAAEDVLARLEGASISGTLQKPFCSQDLVETVNKAVRRTQEETTLHSSA